MSFHTSFSPRGEELIQQYIAGEISDPDAEELVRLLENDEHFGRMAFDNIQSHILLERMARKKTTIDLLLEMDLLDDLFQVESARNTASSSTSRKEESSFRFAFPAALVLCVALLFGVWTEFRPNSVGTDSPRFVPVAQIMETVDAVWEDGREYKKGRQLGVEKLNLIAGIVQLRLSSGVEVVLEGPTEFVLRGGDETFCQTGRVSATVPPQGKGFKVVTPIATIVDQGTKFSLQADREKVDIHVVEGVVDVARSGSDKIQLTTGLAAMLDFQGEIRQFTAESSTFFTSEAVRKLWDAYVERRSTVWETERRQRFQDPALLLSLEDVRVHGCRKVEGARPDETAFRFQSPQEFLGVSLPGSHDSLTLLATVRIESMRNYTNTLCLGSGFLEENGEFFWQLDNNGILRFHIQHDSIQRYDSGGVVQRKDWHTWMSLALVADARNREIRHYVDGRCVATLPWNKPLPLKMPEGALGNAPPELRKRSSRFWSGDMNSFYVFSRAFSDKEISEMYENNR